MVDVDVVERKAQAVSHHVARIRSRGAPSGLELAADEDLWNLTLMDLLQAIQPCIDLAAHVVVDRGLGIVEGPASAFAALASAGWLSKEHATEMAAAAGLRNLIAHRYGELSYDLVAQAAQHSLGHLERFISIVRRRVRDA